MYALVFTKMQQFAAFPQNTRMPTIAYFIDPLFKSAGRPIETAWPDVLLPLTQQLPGFDHIVLTALPDLELEEDHAQEMKIVQLLIKKAIFSSTRKRLEKAMEEWLQNNEVSLLVSFDPHLVLPPFAAKTVLISDANELLREHSGKPWKKTPAKLPEWTTAAAVLLPFERHKKQVTKWLPDLQNLHVLLPALQENCPSISWSEQETVKIRHSGGRDYFLYAGPLTNSTEIINLLKAYSLLKKWLMTGMPLLLAGPYTEQTDELIARLKNYKYRADVTVLPDIDPLELQTLVAGCYLIAYPYAADDPIWPLEWALSAGTPVVTTDHEDTHALLEQGAAFATANDPDAWAHHMMVMYKDEHLRSRIIEQAGTRANQLNQLITLNTLAAQIKNYLAD